MPQSLPNQRELRPCFLLDYVSMSKLHELDIQIDLDPEPLFRSFQNDFPRDLLSMVDHDLSLAVQDSLKTLKGDEEHSFSSPKAVSMVRLLTQRGG